MGLVFLGEQGSTHGQPTREAGLRQVQVRGRPQEEGRQQAISVEPFQGCPRHAPLNTLHFHLTTVKLHSRP